MNGTTPVVSGEPLDLAKPGHQLRWLAAQGARFALPYGRSKKDFPKGWTEDPKPLEQAIQHARSGGNVGLLTGKHSGGIVALDRDVDYPATVAMLGNMAETAKIQRDNAPDRGKLLYRVSGTVLPKSKVWKIRPEDEHPACELLANGRHALIPPSQFGGGHYVLIDAAMGIKEVTPAELDAIWFLITGEYLDGTKAARQAAQEQDDGKAEDSHAYVERVKAAWPTVEVFKHWRKDTAGSEDEKGETRLLGNGGLLVNDWRWFCHADGVGGDQVDAWHWCATDKALDRRDQKAFWNTVNSMAKAAGIAQPEIGHRNGAGYKHGYGEELPDSEDLDEDEDKPKKRSIFDKIKADFAAWGFADLWLSDMDESIWLGDARFSDADRARLRMTARDAGYGKFKLMGALDDAVIAYAAERRRHPVREYFAGLQWDGKDHIAALAAHFAESNEPITYPDGSRRTMFHAALRRWLIGAVAKQHDDEDAARSNFILVLSGAQGSGKSHFARWLCPLPRAFVERHIMPGDKDCSLQRTRSLVWEVMELGATTRRADVEALKAHITQATVSERAAYGHFDTVRPAVASYIGTINSDGAGFLSDTTGNRRFAVVDIAAIDWSYSTAVDVHQVWAQAMHQWQREPKAYRMNPAEVMAFDGNAAEHLEPDVFADALARVFEIDTERADWRCTSTEILDAIRTFGGISRGADKAQAREVARALKSHWGVVGRRSNGKTVYDGLWRKAEFGSDGSY